MNYINPSHPAGRLFPQASGFMGGIEPGAVSADMAEMQVGGCLVVGVRPVMSRAERRARRAIRDRRLALARRIVAMHNAPVVGPVIDPRYKKRKLDPESVMAIRNFAASGVPNPYIAKMFGIKRQTVWSVVTGRAWA